MKKRLLALLLALATVLSLVVIPAYAVEIDTGAATVTEPSATTCGCGCGKKFSEVEWKAWTGEVASGHFYLTGDYTATETINVISGESVVLDLRGYTITTSARVRTFYVNGYVGVLDTVGGGRLSGRTVSGENGGLVEVEDNETAGSAFELFSGTITPASNAGKPDHGGLIKLGTGATFRMYNGLLLNGVTASSKTGGAVFANDFATVEILGGSIVGCTAGSSGGSIYSSGTTVLKNCSIIGGSAGVGGSSGSGGNIYQTGGSLTIENCTIANGCSNTTNKYGGGNIGILRNAKVNITNSKIYGGYALSNGGNLSLAYGTTVIKNTEVYGGSCQGMGGNVSLPIASANVTFDGCTIDGDMDNIIGKLTLKGATKISNNNGGLDLTEQTKTTTATGLTSGAEVYVSGNKTLTGKLDYIKPSLNCTLTASGTTLTVAPAADGVEAGYCPHCNAKTAWQPYGTAGAAHVYLTADMASFAEVTVSGDLCIDTRGFDITATGRAFTVAEGSKLALIDSVGGSVITGKGVTGENGGVILNNGELILQGGKYIYKSGNTVTGGGIVYSAGSLTAHGVVMDASAFANTAANGGAICFADGAGATTVMGGYIIGGNASYGGSVYGGYNNALTFTGVCFTGGKAAASGGNISFVGTSSKKQGSLRMTGCMVSGGTAGESGGNMQAKYYATATVTDCYITGGTAENYGGNITNASTTMPVTSCYITSGTATGAGGGNINTATLSSNLSLVDCIVLGGAATGTSGVGGNIRAYLGEVVNIDGGLIAYGTAATTGGNLYTRCTVNIGTAANGQPVRVLRGTAGTCGGNLHVLKGDTVADQVYFSGGAAPEGGDVYITDGSLTLKSGVMGAICLNADSSLATSTANGKAISNITCQATKASFYMDGAYGNCGTLVKDETIYVATTAVMDKAGNAVWYSSNADAVAACDKNTYLKLFTDEDLVLTKDLYVDINGQTVNVSGDYTLYGMDSSGDGYQEPAGKAVLTGTTLADVTDAPNGKTYISLENSFHRLGMAITGVSIRPSADGMYYTAKWSCDDTLKAMIASYGVVASTANMPGSDFATEEENLWTTFTQDSFVSGQTKNGAVISGIMSETADDNDGRGKSPIYAKAYITFENGDTLVSRDNIGYSLCDVMKNLDRLIMAKPLQYRKYNQTAREFYEKWKDNGMGSWKMNKIPKPEDDGVIDVLMVGNSFCSYYVQELYALGQAAGIDIRVCNLYYSGCPLDKHYNWWVEGKSNYQYYETFHDGRKLTPYVSLEWGLAQQNWDFISLQQASSKMEADGAQTHFEETQQYWEPLYDYLLQQFPDTQMLWQTSWANQFVDHQKSGTTITSAEDQRTYTQTTEDFAKLLCDYYNDDQTLIRCVPSGRAWQNVRDGGYDFLCCRLDKTNDSSGVAHAGDGYHDGDIGGGQYLNACVWFEIVTGKSVIGNSYIPEYATSATLSDSLLAQVKVEKTANGYKLTDALAAQLQAAAHDAVAATGFTVTE